MERYEKIRALHRKNDEWTNEKKRIKKEKEAGSQSYLSADNKTEARQEAIEAQDGGRGMIEASRAEREA